MMKLLESSKNKITADKNGKVSHIKNDTFFN